MSFPLTRIKSDKSFDELAPFHVCDIEAHKWIKFRCIGSYDGSNFEEFRSISDYFAFMVHDNIDKEIYAHFGGGYDFNFLLDWLMFDGAEEGFYFDKMIPRGGTILGFDVCYRHEWRDEDGVRQFDSCKLKFFDSSAFLPFSLKKITESFGVEHKKGDFNFDKWDGKITDELLSYLQDDCRGLWEAIDTYRRWPLIRSAGHAKTMASQALKVFQTFMRDDIPSLSRRSDEFVRKSYFGGRTEIFKPYYESETDPLNCYDANSLYPKIMLSCDMPLRCNGRVFKYDPESLGHWHVDVEVPDSLYIPPLGVVHQVESDYESQNKHGHITIKKALTDKFIFPTGKFTGYWSTAELEYALSLGCKIHKVHSGLTFDNGGRIFETYINTLYDMRLQAQARGDAVTEILCKLLMNSLYGRFGLQLERESIYFDNDINRQQVEIYRTITRGDQAVEVFKEMQRINSFANVAIAAEVTSQSRILMHQHYMKLDNQIWYTDTDSLFTPKKLPTSKILGELKWEYDGDRACFLLPKTYAIESAKRDEKEYMKKVVMKGFDRKKVQSFSLDQFYTALDGDLRALRATNPAKFCKFRSAMSKGKFLAMMDEQDRAIRTRYDKRRVVKTSHQHFDTEPLVIREGSIIN